MWDLCSVGFGICSQPLLLVQVPCLLQLKLCPSVVFAGVDDAQDVTGDTFQELFQAGGFVVSDEELLDRVTLGECPCPIPKSPPASVSSGDSCPSV